MSKGPELDITIQVQAWEEGVGRTKPLVVTNTHLPKYPRALKLSIGNESVIVDINNLYDAGRLCNEH